jgi:hypothetical protein
MTRVWNCMLCAYVIEEGGDGKGRGQKHHLSCQWSYILRYISLTQLGTLYRFGLRDPMHLCT